MSDKKSGKGPIISAAIGAAFFAVPYVGLSIPLLPSIGIAIAAFGAGNLLFSPEKNNGIIGEFDLNRDLSETINTARKQNNQISLMIKKIDDLNLREEISEITDTASKIIDAVEKNPEKYDKAKNFFEYYLPVTLKIIVEYDNIENQRLNNDEVKKFMSTAESMIYKINKSFKTQLSNLYQTNMLDTDAEMKVFDSMLNLDGFNEISDFNLKGGNKSE